MTTLTLKEELHKTIDSISDKTLLEAVYVLLQTKTPPQSALKPMSKTDFHKRNAKSQKDIAEGKLYTQASLKKRFR